MHDPPHIIRPPLDQQMNVIGHQAVGLKIKGKLLLLPGEQLNELPIVLRRMKDVPPIHPSRRHIIKPALDPDPRFPRHLLDDTISTK